MVSKVVPLVIVMQMSIGVAIRKTAAAKVGVEADSRSPIITTMMMMNQNKRRQEANRASYRPAGNTYSSRGSSYRSSYGGSSYGGEFYGSTYVDYETRLKEAEAHAQLVTWCKSQRVQDESCSSPCGGGKIRMFLPAENKNLTKCYPYSYSIEQEIHCNDQPCPESLVKTQQNQISKTGMVDVEQTHFHVDLEASGSRYRCDVVITQPNLGETILTIDKSTGKVKSWEGDLYVEAGATVAWSGCEMQTDSTDYMSLREEKVTSLADMNYRDMIRSQGVKELLLGVDDIAFKYNVMIKDAPPLPVRAGVEIARSSTAALLWVRLSHSGSHQIDAINIYWKCRAANQTTETSKDGIDFALSSLKYSPNGKYLVKLAGLVPGASCAVDAQAKSSAGSSKSSNAAKIRFIMPVSGCPGSLWSPQKCCQGPSDDAMMSEFSRRCMEWSAFSTTCSALGKGWQGARNEKNKRDNSLCSHFPRN